ncbi:hypothetical protein T03_4740 [Trichinella britovi]|uniref:Uncharacterized protein n=1 Tax=Trichinella britovi TaxID=45882 RepID=A0A0V0Z0K9_TRIBR|nr:hypothetical protein T03_4740 [Trichinella britovi]
MKYLYFAACCWYNFAGSKLKTHLSDKHYLSEKRLRGNVNTI